MAKTLKCNRCNNKYRIYAVAEDKPKKDKKKDKKKKCKHIAYKLYSEDTNLRFYTIQKTVGKIVNNFDYDKKGRVVCDCPKCHQLMVAV